MQRMQTKNKLKNMQVVNIFINHASYFFRILYNIAFINNYYNFFIKYIINKTKILKKLFNFLTRMLILGMIRMTIKYFFEKKSRWPNYFGILEQEKLEDG